MLVVDSGVWIDFFNAAPTPAAELLAQLLQHGEVRIVVPDLVLFEVLRGFRSERDLRQARLLLEGMSLESTGGTRLALAAVNHYRSLRTHGVTIASAIDTLLAAWCIEQDYALLHRDADFDAFESRRGLRVWRH